MRWRLRNRCRLLRLCSSLSLSCWSLSYYVYWCIRHGCSWCSCCSSCCSSCLSFSLPSDFFSTLLFSPFLCLFSFGFNTCFFLFFYFVFKFFLKLFTSFLKLCKLSFEVICLLLSQLFFDQPGFLFFLSFSTLNMIGLRNCLFGVLAHTAFVLVWLAFKVCQSRCKH